LSKFIQIPIPGCIEKIDGVTSSSSFTKYKDTPIATDKWRIILGVEVGLFGISVIFAGDKKIRLWYYRSRYVSRFDFSGVISHIQ